MRIPRIFLSGSTWAMNLPRYREAICPAMAEMVMGAVRKKKNWLTKDRKAHRIMPSAHVRKVRAGMLGSSVSGTVSFTSSIDISVSSCGQYTHTHTTMNEISPKLVFTTKPNLQLIMTWDTSSHTTFQLLGYTHICKRPSP